MRRPWIACVALLIWQSVANASACTQADGATSSTGVGGLGKKVYYGFVASDSRWVVFPFGWHATAQLSCENCSDEGEIGAYAWLAVGEGGGLGFVTEDETEFMAVISSMWFSGYRGTPPVADGESEPIRWDGFAGHARRFVGVGKDGQKEVLIGARLTDGCAHVRLYTAVGQVKADSALAYLQPMLEGVHVERR